MLDADQVLLAEIEAFMKGAAMKPTKFGVEALGDPNFVFELREGRSPSGKTATRVRRYMFARQALAAQAEEPAA